jgi:hypothetical protein
MDIQSGSVQVNFEGKAYALDLILIKLMFEELEAEFPPRSSNGYLTPMPEMLKATAQRLKAEFDMPATPTAAYHIWLEINRGFLELKKSIESTPSSPTGSESTPTN